MVVNFNDAMTTLFIELFKAYVDRKDERVLVPDNPKRLIRGTSVSNSSVFENQMGLLLHSQLHEDYQILIDYPIIFPGRNNRITPDILILKENAIQMVLELKVDLGYEAKGWEQKRIERLEKLKKYKNDTGCKPLNEKTMMKEARISLNVPDDINYATVIFCYKYGAQLIEEVVRNINDSKSDDRSDYPFFILLRDRSIHPSDMTNLDDAAEYISSMKKEAKVDWDVFEKYLRNRLVFRT